MSDRTTAYAIQWHRSVVSGGWIRFLSAASKDLIHFAVCFAVDRAVPLTYAQVKEITGLTKQPLMQVISELEGYGLLSRVPQETLAKANAWLKSKRIQATEAEIMLKLLEPYQLTEVDRWLLKDAQLRKAVELLVSTRRVTESHLKTIRAKSTKIKRSGLSNDMVWYGVFERLLMVMKDRQEKDGEAIPLPNILAFLRPTNAQELDTISRELFPDKTPSTPRANLTKLNAYERRVVDAYELYTGKRLLENEVDFLREALRICLPVQLETGIRRLGETIPSFEYLMPMIRAGKFGRRPNKKQNRQGATGNTQRPVGQAVSQSGWNDRRMELKRKAEERKQRNQQP